jgi:D-glycero-D-manno-heptose 1,7-bisphosphate phosphatase
MLKATYGNAWGERALFLDRDGIINERNDSGYILSRDELHFKGGIGRALEPLADRRLPIVVVSNQSCVGRSLLSAEAAAGIMDAMKDGLEDRGVRILGWYCCPHIPDDGCCCRKPMPGLILRAASDLSIDVAESYLIGDKQWDLDAGIEAGCRISMQVDEHQEDALTLAVRAICEDLDATT